jgi:hypothetical protein
MAEDFQGGCLCGAIRYVARGEPMAVAFCHCSMCRRSAGAPVVAWAMWQRDRLEITRGKPTVFASSSGVERGFCSACGTQLTYVADFLPGLIDVTVGSMDEPDRLPPTMHIWASKKVPWLELGDTLPRHSEFPDHPLK